MRLDDTLEGYWLSRRRDLSPNTQRDYELTFRRLSEFLGNPEFSSITSDDLDRFLNHLQDDLHLADKTRLNHWIALSALWTWAEAKLKVEHILRGDRVGRPKAKRRQRLAYEEAEVRAILEACDTMKAWDTKRGSHVLVKRPTAIRDRAIIMVLVDSGLRISELTALRMRDYDRKKGQLVILHGKGDKRRVLYLGETARQSLWRYLTDRGKVVPDDFLFVNRNDAQLDRNATLHLIQRLGERSGVPNAGPHRFRHTFAINYLRNGGNLLALQEMLGHEKLDTVRIYAKLAELDLQKSQKAASPADNWRL